MSEDHNLYAVLRAGFPADLDGTCIDADAGRRFSWRELDAQVARFANLLASLGLARGARVACQVEKSPEALMLYLATLRAGLAFQPLNTAYREAEIDYFVGNAEPAVVVCAPGNLSWMQAVTSRHAVPHLFTLDDAGGGSLVDASRDLSADFDTVRVGPDDLAAILYTSGTTGRSKGAMLSHRNLVSNARVLHLAWRWRTGDVLLHALPIFHVHGLFVAAHGALLSGSPMIWMNRYDPKAVAARLPEATVFMGVPTMYTRLLDEPAFTRECTRNMRLFVSGSAPLLADTFRAFEDRTGHRILERYGMSETVMLTSNPCDGTRRPGTVGLPLAGVQVRVVDDAGAPCATDVIGQVQVKGPNVFSAYWRMPEKTAEEFTADGWFRTGDVGRFDATGYLAIVGRSKDLIITGGYNVYPKEIEGWLDELPGVLESAVVGVPHHDFGEAVVAAVVARPGATLDPTALVAELKTRIAGFKVPKAVHLLPELPRNQMGKVQKNQLRERFASSFSDS